MDINSYKHINILVYPSSGCNFRCKYCFHAKGSYENITMSREIVDKLFHLVFESYNSAQFIWHGGEPLLAGIDFFEYIVELENKYKRKKNINVYNAIMTNGSLINNEYAKFFKENKFDVGVSYDGLDHEFVRGHTKAVIEGIETLKEYGNDVDLVSIITRRNVDKQIENYIDIKKLGCEMKFNPVMKIGGGDTLEIFDLKLEEYISESIRFFDYWLFDKECDIIVGPFYHYVRDILENTSSICHRTSCLGRWLGVTTEGDVYPCVRENRKEYKFGNIDELENLQEVFLSDAFNFFLEGSISRRIKCEKNCKLYDYCQGGCPVNALIEGGINQNGGFSCQAFKCIFKYIYEKLYKVIQNGEMEKLNPTVRKLMMKNPAYIDNTMQFPKFV